MIEVGSYCCFSVERPLSALKARPCWSWPLRFFGLGIGVMNSARRRRGISPCYYNFVRPHGALKFGRETRTPAMQAGLATRRLTLRDIFVSVRRVIWWLGDVLAFADSHRTAAAAVMYMPVAA